MYEGSNFSTCLLTPVIFYFLIIAILVGMKVVSHCGFDLHFPMTNDVEHFFHVPIVNLYIFFGETSIQVLCPFLNWVVCLFVKL